MNWLKLAFWLLIIGLIVGAFIGLTYLMIFVFVAIFNGLADLMIAKGADASIASVVALILTVYIFKGISSNTTIQNKVKEYGEKAKGKVSEEEI